MAAPVLAVSGPSTRFVLGDLGLYLTAVGGGTMTGDGSTEEGDDVRAR